MIQLLSIPESLKVFNCVCGKCKGTFECLEADYEKIEISKYRSYDCTSYGPKIIKAVKCPYCGNYIAEAGRDKSEKDRVFYSSEKLYFPPESTSTKIDTKKSMTYQLLKLKKDQFELFNDIKKYFEEKKAKKGESLI